MHDLKERLEPVKLSDAQKERILCNVKEGRIELDRGRGWKLGPLIVSGIVAVAMVWIVVGLLTEPASLFERGADSRTANVEEQTYSMRSLIFAGIATIFMFISTVTLWRNLQVVKRWQTNEKLQKLRMYMEKKPYYISVYFGILVIIWGGALQLSWSELYVEIWFGVFFGFSIFMWEVWLTRDNEWSKCPHCGEPMTRKAIRKKTMWQYRETCDACGELIYLNKSESSNLEIVGLPLSFVIYFSVLNLNIVLTIVMMVTTIWLTMRYITPYTYQFTKEPDPNDKLW